MSRRKKYTTIPSKEQEGSRADLRSPVRRSPRERPCAWARGTARWRSEAWCGAGAHDVPDAQVDEVAAVDVAAVREIEITDAPAVLRSAFPELQHEGQKGQEPLLVDGRPQEPGGVGQPQLPVLPGQIPSLRYGHAEKPGALAILPRAGSICARGAACQWIREFRTLHALAFVCRACILISGKRKPASTRGPPSILDACRFVRPPSPVMDCNPLPDDRDWLPAGFPGRADSPGGFEEVSP